MKMKSIRLLGAMAMLCCASWAQALITCTAPVSSGFSTAYAATGIVPNVTQGSVSFTCTRGAAGDATDLILWANNGIHAAGGQNRAQINAANRIRYEAYKDSGCSAVWSNNSVASAIPVTLLNNTSPQAISMSFWGCITVAGQGGAAGSYTDRLTVTVRSASGLITYATNNNVPVNITFPASCSITTPPGNIVFSYTAFGPVVNASTTFVTNCTINLPYSMSLNANGGVVSGLNYALQINAQTPPVNSRNPGPFLAQFHTINGSMPAGQAGTCSTSSCVASQLHTLTITF